MIYDTDVFSPSLRHHLDQIDNGLMMMVADEGVALAGVVGRFEGCDATGVEEIVFQ